MDAALREVPEASATGRVARVYADIRRVLGVPFVVLVYRVLANEPALLERVWEDVAPNVASPYGRESAAELGRLAPATVERIPPRLLGTIDPAAARATLDGFRRANGANLLGLTALLDGVGGAPAAGSVPAYPRPLGEALPMADLRTLPPATLELLERMSVPVAGSERPVLVPSLFRCFAHDGELLSELWARLQPQLEGPAFAPAATVIRRRAGELASALPYRVRRLDEERVRTVVARFVRTLPGMILAGSLIEQALGEFLPPPAAAPCETGSMPLDGKGAS